jgi:alpha-L-fucosidase
MASRIQAATGGQGGLVPAPPGKFCEWRYGMIVHYGLYSLLERGEWVMNREQIPVADYRRLAHRFEAQRFDPGAICDLAVRAGMRYVVLTTMHHDGYRLYPTALSDFCSRRDWVAEFTNAARARGLGIGLYHSLNNWTDQPDAVAALEDPAAYEVFIRQTFERVRELVSRYNPIDVLWYDGWWPFNAEGWQAERMNAMVRAIQPHILFNGRNGLPGDFATPEGHLGAPQPWRPWEACMTLNGSWGYHRGDQDWKTPGQVADLLMTCAQRRGNLLLNIGPRGDGSIPEPSVRVLETVGDWLRRCGEGLFDTDAFTFDLRERGTHRGEWSHHGPFTARGNSLYWFPRRWPGETATWAGLESRVLKATLLGSDRNLAFHQQGGQVTLTGLPAEPPDPVCPVVRLDCDRPPVLYLTGGLRTPRVAHPHYDPCPSDIAH